MTALAPPPEHVLDYERLSLYGLSKHFYFVSRKCRGNNFAKQFCFDLACISDKSDEFFPNPLVPFA